MKGKRHTTEQKIRILRAADDPQGDPKGFGGDPKGFGRFLLVSLLKPRGVKKGAN